MSSRAAPYLVGGILVVLLVGGAAGLYYSRYRSGFDDGEQAERMLWQTKWDRQTAELANARAALIVQAREEEQRRQAQIEKVREDAEHQIAKAKTDAANADAVASRMHAQAQRLAARASRCTQHTGAAQGGTSGGQSAMVLAELFRRADQRAGELAAAYDRARVAGIACELAYDALSATQPHR